MTTFALFNLLNKQEQADLLLEEGNYLYTRQEPEFLIDLYELEGFFVEVYYHKKQEELIVVKCFKSGEQSAPLHNTMVSDLTVAWKNPFLTIRTVGHA